VCKTNYVFAKGKGDKCVSRDSEVGKTLISPEDTGATCKWKGCSMEAAVCNSEKKCMCIPGYSWRDGGCKVSTTTEEPAVEAKEGSTTLSVDEDGGSWEWPDVGGEAASPSPPGTETIADTSQAATPEKSAAGAACSANAGCATLNLAGDCCPAPNGMMLGCCR